MPRTVTLTFDDGTKHVYDNVPDNVTPDQVKERAAKEFAGKALKNIDGGKGSTAPKEESFLDKAIGAGEAGLSAITGAVGGGLGQLGGTIGGIAGMIAQGDLGNPEAVDRAAQGAQESAAALTYQPHTPAGQRYAGNIADLAESAAPLAGMIPEVNQLASMGRLSAPALRNAAQDVAVAAKPVTQAIKSAIVPAGEAAPALDSAGAMRIPQAQIREMQAAELPVPIQLTEAQKTRQFAAQQFEREAAKNAELGDPLRQRFADQNLQLQQNLDAFIDMTGAEAPDLRSVGVNVDAALRGRAAKDKAAIRVAYKDAEKAGELEQPVALDSVIQHLNENVPEGVVAKIVPAARAKALQLGIAAEDADGNLVAQPTDLKTAELFRKSINAITDNEPTNIRQATIMKRLVDDATAGAGGDIYKKARSLRTRYANDYENSALVKNILNTKGNSNDRAIALEDVLNRSIISPSASLDDVRNVRRLLQTEGTNGQQAWRDLQGATLRHIRDEATKNVARDVRGNQVVSAAALERSINNLDKSGKLQFVFGKKGAEQLRLLNEVAKDVITSPPGSVNTSNTASIVTAAMDIMMSGSTGIPLPIATGLRIAGRSVKDRRLKNRINAALGNSGRS